MSFDGMNIYEKNVSANIEELKSRNKDGKNVNFKGKSSEDN